MKLISSRIVTFVNDNPVVILYLFNSLLFLFGTLIYDRVGLFSDYYTIITLQIIISSFIINSIIAAGLAATQKKDIVVYANSHILLVLYFNLVFQIYQRCILGFPKIEFVASLFLAMILTVFIVLVTNENYFNEKIWSMTVYFSLLYIFEINHNKYFTALFAIVFLVNVAYKMQIYMNIKLNKFYYKYIDSDFEARKLFNYYGSISIIYWCCIYYTLQSIFGKNNLATFIIIGFWVPNMLLILQQLFPKCPIIYITIVCYFFFNVILQKAQIHAKNVILDPEMLNKLDETFSSIKQDRYWHLFGPLRNHMSKLWTGFKQITKESINAGGGPKNWGPGAAGAAGVAVSTYYGHRYISQNDEANEIAQRANEIAQRANETAQRANEIAERGARAQEKANELASEQTKELQRNNQLLEESNAHTKRGADAAVEYTNMARKQEGLESELD